MSFIEQSLTSLPRSLPRSLPWSSMVAFVQRPGQSAAVLRRSAIRLRVWRLGSRFNSSFALEPALGQIGRAFDALEGYSDRPAGTIRIDASIGAAEQILEPMLIEFLRQHPDMRLDIRADDALVDIASGGFDCGLRLMELVPEDMVAIPVGPEQQHIVVAAPLYLQDTPDLSSPADLHAHECIQLRLSGAARYRWEFERRGEAFSVATEALSSSGK